MIDLNVRAKTVKLLKKKKKEKICGFGLGKNFLRYKKHKPQKKKKEVNGTSSKLKRFLIKKHNQENKEERIYK